VPSPETELDSRACWHEVMLGLAGQLTDEDLTQARRLLADGREAMVAGVIRGAIQPGHIELPGRATARLIRLLADAGIADADGLVGVRDEPGLPRFRYSAVSPGGGGLDDPGDGDAQEQAIIARAPECGVRELYRVWRYPPVALLQPRRIYLVTADPDADLAGIAGQLQEALSRAGDAAPQVEVCPEGAELGGYHRDVYAGAETLWLDADPSRVRMASLPDRYGFAGEPFLASGHERIADALLRDQMLHYLRSGKAVNAAGGWMGDILDPSRPGAVPGGLRTDGEWVWPDAVAYYLERYHLAPEPGLAGHISARGFQPTEPGAAALRNVRAFLIRHS
jgi:hypothetical protein